MKLGHYNLVYLAILILGLYYILNLILNKLETNGFKKFQAPSIFTLITGLLFLINTYCWNWPIINPFLIDSPDISGKYEGSLNIRHLDNKLKEIPNVDVVIRQTGTNIDFDLYSKKGSHSRNIITEIIKTNENWNIYTIYTNENVSNPDNRNKYEGASKFEIKTENDTINLIGQFYTDETRKSYGTIHLKRISN